MQERVSVRDVYISLPVRDTARSRAFWEALGFGFDERFSDSRSLCLLLRQGVRVMLIRRDYYQTFTNRPATDGSSSQVLLTLDVGSRERADEIVHTALVNGASRYLDSSDSGWMDYDRFEDPDGHQWEIAFIDEDVLRRQEMEEA